MATRSLENCVGCHKVPSLNAAFQGKIAPTLDGAGNRWSAAELHGIVANAKKSFPASMMQGFYKSTGYTHPGDDFTCNGCESNVSPPLLSAKQLEDVVA